MEKSILVIHIVAALLLILFILIQQGKGADAGATFGGGAASQTVFGSQGSGNFLSKCTGWLAVLFLLTSGALAFFARQGTNTLATPQLIDQKIIEKQMRQSDIPALEPANPSKNQKETSKKAVDSSDIPVIQSGDSGGSK